MKRQDLAIASPCAMDWNTMTAEGRKRFCDACKKHVHDLSSMKEAEAVALLQKPPAEGLCVRYLYNAYGEVLFDMVDTRIVPASRLVRARRALESGAAAAGVALSLAACGGSHPKPMMGAPPPVTQVDPHASSGQMMGDIAPPRETMGEPPPIPSAPSSSVVPPAASVPVSTAAPSLPKAK